MVFEYIWRLAGAPLFILFFYSLFSYGPVDGTKVALLAGLCLLWVLMMVLDPPPDQPALYRIFFFQNAGIGLGVAGQYFFYEVRGSAPPVHDTLVFELVMAVVFAAGLCSLWFALRGPASREP